ncbi:antibiotic biosynthesis monooxygenase family protein [Nocardia wallacei]|uniref:antibiotic biosynthesis monooxygenase family protein n=1 Tax=Nocardia wallacei TaxID=480035 RepID=UPI003CC7D1F7
MWDSSTPHPVSGTRGCTAGSPRSLGSGWSTWRTGTVSRRGTRRTRAELMSAAPGFRDNRLHRAVDPDTRFQLVNIAHWDSPEAWDAARSNPRFQQRLSAAPDFATPNPALFRVAAEF